MKIWQNTLVNLLLCLVVNTVFDFFMLEHIRFVKYYFIAYHYGS